MKQYHDLLKHVLENGTDNSDRTGVGTRSVFGYQMRFDLQQGFPLVTTKKVSFRFIVEELIWFLNGCKGGIAALKEKGVTIWNEWEHLEVPGVIVPYGNMWREWKVTENEFIGEKDCYAGRSRRQNLGKIMIWKSKGSVYGWYIDQILDLIESIEYNRHSRRHILESWNVGEINNFVLPPCHKTAQFHVNNGKLSCMLYMRSNDLFLGCPYNIAQYALLTQIIANICGLELGELIYTIGDAHIYLNHIEQVKLQLSRDFRDLPTVAINRKLSASDLDLSNFILSYADFTLHNYNPHPKIDAPVAV